MAIENKFIQLFVNGLPARAQSSQTEILFQGIGVGDVASGLFITESAGNHFDFNAKRLENLADPTADQHAATKKYVDDEIGALNITGTAWALGGNTLTQAEKFGSLSDHNVSMVREDVAYITLDKDGADLGIAFEQDTYHANGNSAIFLDSADNVGANIYSPSSGRLYLEAPNRFRFITSGMSGANLEILGDSASPLIRPGFSSNTSGRNLVIRSGNLDANDALTYSSGAILIESATPDEGEGDLFTGNTGDVNIRSGNTNPLLAGGFSGDLNLFSGDAADGNSGDIRVKTGTSSATRGKIILDALSTESVANHNPSLDEGASLGTSSLRWADVYATDHIGSSFGSVEDNNVTFVRDSVVFMSLLDVSGDDVLQIGANVANVDFNGIQLTGLPAPTVGSDAATKDYVDGLAAGLQTKASVFCATTAPLPAATYDNGAGTLTGSANGALGFIDTSVEPGVGAAILVKDQVDPIENGIYEVVAMGDVSNPYVLVRRDDFDGSPAQEVTGGAYVFVEFGTLNINSGWVLQGNGVKTLGTDALTWAKFSTQGVVTAGAGLSKTGNEFSIVTGDAIYIDGSNQVAVDYRKTYINQAFSAILVREVAMLSGIIPGEVLRVNATNVEADAELVVAFSEAAAEGGSAPFYVREGAIIPGFSGLSVGNNVYLARTGNGLITQDIGSFEAGDKVWVIGKAVSATEVKYKPQYLYEIL
jgi:hypothetical protein